MQTQNMSFQFPIPQACHDESSNGYEHRQKFDWFPRWTPFQRNTTSQQTASPACCARAQISPRAKRRLAEARFHTKAKNPKEVRSSDQVKTPKFKCQPGGSNTASPLAIAPPLTGGVEYQTRQQTSHPRSRSSGRTGLLRDDNAIEKSL